MRSPDSPLCRRRSDEPRRLVCYPLCMNPPSRRRRCAWRRRVRRSPWTASTWSETARRSSRMSRGTSSPGSTGRCSAPTAPARPRCFRSSPGISIPPAGSVRVLGHEFGRVDLRSPSPVDRLGEPEPGPATPHERERARRRRSVAGSPASVCSSSGPTGRTSPVPRDCSMLSAALISPGVPSVFSPRASSNASWSPARSWPTSAS